MMRSNAENIKNMYKAGTNIVLDYMDDDYAPASGTKGTIEYVDDAGNIHVRWENGSGLSLIPGVDIFHIVK